MSKTVTLTVKLPNMTAFVNSAINDRSMLAIHQLLERMCRPYVPMDTGLLADTTDVTPQNVTYTQIYSNYMYNGIVYGPNFPQFDDFGNIIGWKSPPKKYPTDRELQYSKEKNALATKEWDKAMMRDKSDLFTQQVANIIAKELNNLANNR